MERAADSKMRQTGSQNSRSKFRSSSIIRTQSASYYSLSTVEKQFLLYAERGDCASARKSVIEIQSTIATELVGYYNFLRREYNYEITEHWVIEEYKNKPNEFKVDCMDPLNRSALIIAIEKENIDLILILLEAGIKMKDALLHAINEEYVEGVEVLLQWEEKTRIEGQPYSWEVVDKSSSGFTLDITPVILAAHTNNYEILKLLLDRGATLPVIHDVRCGCDDCVTSLEQDSLRHSQARINAYKAMTSPSLICLSSKDPLLTAIELYRELKRLEILEAEFRSEYNGMRQTVQLFATSLLDHVRTSKELEIMLNYDPHERPWQPGERQTLSRLRLAIKSKLKMFVAHPNVQQFLASIWYGGLPSFRRKSTYFQIINAFKMSCMFAVYSVAYMVDPLSHLGKCLQTPFVKFICQSASYGFFLGLLALASQKVELLCYQFLGYGNLEDWLRKERGSWPGVIETLIIIYVISLIWKEIRALYSDGLQEYLTDLWNILDFISNVFYLIWIGLRFTAIYIVLGTVDVYLPSFDYSHGEMTSAGPCIYDNLTPGLDQQSTSWLLSTDIFYVLCTQREHKQNLNPWYPKSDWDSFDPHAVSECAFASSVILSFMKLVNIFSINPHLGPLQISLGRMIIDILKFFFVYTLVLFAFGCGLNQLLWYYAGLEEMKCYHNGTGEPDFEDADKACTTWRRFTNLFETSQSLYWAGFGLVDLTAFDLTGIKSFTRFWALLIFGCYSAINIIVLINMLIAMMSNSYQIISERSDIEWKYARSKLFISFFGEEDTLPPPFNLFPTVKSCVNLFAFRRRKKKSASVEHSAQINREMADLHYSIVMQMLIRRYVTAEQKKLEEFAVTEDDIAEVRHDISSFRFELLDVFRKNNFIVPKGKDLIAQGKKERIMERRINKDFQIGVVEGVVNDIISSEKGTKNIFDKIAKAIGRTESEKKNWNNLVRSGSQLRDPIGNTSEVQRKKSLQNIRRYILQYRGMSAMEMDSDKLVEYNPQLSEISPLARIAYAKFKMLLIQQEYEGFRNFSIDGDFANLEALTSSRNNSLKSNQSAGRLSRSIKKSSMKLERALTQTSLRNSEIINIPSSIHEEPPMDLSRQCYSEVQGIEQSRKDDSLILSVQPEKVPSTSSPRQSQPTIHQTPFLRGKFRPGNWL